MVGTKNCIWSSLLGNLRARTIATSAVSEEDRSRGKRRCQDGQSNGNGAGIEHICLILILVSTCDGRLTMAD